MVWILICLNVEFVRNDLVTSGGVHPRLGCKPLVPSYVQRTSDGLGFLCSWRVIEKSWSRLVPSHVPPISSPNNSSISGKGFSRLVRYRCACCLSERYSCRKDWGTLSWDRQSFWIVTQVPNFQLNNHRRTPTSNLSLLSHLFSWNC